MKVTPTHLSTIVLLTCLTMATAAAAAAGAAQPGTRFDFQYRVTDARINVFDDAKSTRLQLPEGMQLPVILAPTPAGERLLTPRRDGVYLLIDGLWPQLALVWPNNRTVHIQYSGAITAEREGRAAAHPAIAATQITGAQSAPVNRPPANPTAELAQLNSAILQASKEKTPNLEPHKSADSENSKAQPKVADSSEKEKTATDRALPTIMPAQLQTANLRIETGQRLSLALKHWLAQQQIQLVWDVNAPGERIRDIEMVSAWQASTTDIQKTLEQLLPSFGLRAIIQDYPKTVIVRAVSGSNRISGAAK